MLEIRNRQFMTDETSSGVLLVGTARSIKGAPDFGSRVADYPFDAELDRVFVHELGRLSSGAAAALAGIPRIVFLMKLADYPPVSRPSN